MIKYIIKTQNQIYECKNYKVLVKKINALVLLGINDFVVYEIMK